MQMANEITGVALGMIETRGLVPAIEAADAMTKAAEARPAAVTTFSAPGPIEVVTAIARRRPLALA